MLLPEPQRQSRHVAGGTNDFPLRGVRAQDRPGGLPRSNETTIKKLRIRA